jgi:sugar phosphate isomerase/epimerase
MPTTRRRFLGLVAGACSAPAVLSAGRRAERLPIAFSTLGCPRWDWGTILERAAQWGYAAIELRGLQGEMDLTKRPEFSGARLAASLKDLDAVGLRVSGLFKYQVTSEQRDHADLEIRPLARIKNPLARPWMVSA